MPSPTLPIPSGPLVGRDADVARVRALWAAERLVVVEGPDGVGRSRVAMEVARQEDEAGAAIVWVGVTGATLVAGGDGGAVARAVAKALGAAADVDVVASVGWALAGRGPTSLVLDTLEGGAEVLTAWLAAAPALRILVTARARGVLPGVVRHRVEGLPVPEGGASPSEALRSPAVAMFLARTGIGTAGLPAPTDEEVRDAVAIVRAVAGLPLAIELCAGARAGMPLDELRGVVERWIPGGAPGGDDEALAAVLRGAVEVAWRLLPPDEARALAWLSVFRGGWTPEAAAEVLPPGPSPTALLDALADRSLVRVTRRVSPGGAAARYTLPDTIRAEAERRLWGYGEAADAMARHARCFGASGTQAAGEALDGPGGAARWRALMAERENLVAAIRRLPEHGEADAAAHAMIALFNLLLLLGPVQDGLELIEPVAARSDIPLRTRARLMRVHGDLLTLAGRLEEAWRVFDAAEGITRGLGDPVLLSRLWLSTAIWFQERGEADAAVPYLERGLALPGIGPRQAGLLNTARSTCAYAKGELDAARGFSEAALAAHREVGNERMVSMTLTNLALILLDGGRAADALQLLHDALPITERLHNRRQEADVRRVTALALLELDEAGETERAAEAVELLRTAAALYAAVGMRRMEGVARAALAGAMADLDVDASEREAVRALALARAVGNRRNEAMALGRVGSARLRAGRDGSGAFTEALTLAEGLRRQDRAILWAIRGEAELTIWEEAEARACLQRARALIEGETSGEGWVAARRLERALEG